jgi:hypothetical protein
MFLLHAFTAEGENKLGRFKSIPVGKIAVPTLQMHYILVGTWLDRKHHLILTKPPATIKRQRLYECGWPITSTQGAAYMYLSYILEAF